MPAGCALEQAAVRAAEAMPRPNDTESPACPLCDAATYPSAEVPGYQLPERFPIHGCTGCGLSFAGPLTAAPEFYERLYERLYAQRSRLRAYEDYTRIAAAVTDHASPLDFLAREGPCYWGVRQALAHTPRGARILEVGCGLGYLTFALARAGYDATGVDISERAVAEARRQFGPRFRRVPSGALARAEPGSYDAIVLVELLEHVPEPLELLRSLVPLLRESGRILMTTPNKSAYPAGTLWQTDLPPVHLWWFSEPSVRAMAERLGLAVSFVDYSADTRGHGRSLRVKWPGAEIFMAPQLDAGGGVVSEPESSEIRRYFPGEKLGLRQRMLWARYKLDPSRRVRQTERRATMTAVLERI